MDFGGIDPAENGGGFLYTSRFSANSLIVIGITVCGVTERIDWGVGTVRGGVGNFYT